MAGDKEGEMKVKIKYGSLEELKTKEEKIYDRFQRYAKAIKIKIENFLRLIYMKAKDEQRTLIIIKPDALQRNLLGEIIARFERKGLKIIGLKMMAIDDFKINEHYEHHKDKPFFESLKRYMQSCPVVAMVLVGYNAIDAARLIVGPTKGYEADAGSIRGDFSLSNQCNILHTSDSLENAEKEIWRFFNEDELFEYKKIDFEFIYGEDERES